MNALLEKVINSRKGHYCHVVEVSDVYELEAIAEAIVSENQNEFDAEAIIDFLETLTVYYMENEEESEEYNKEKETEVYAFNFREYITTSLN